VAKVGYFGKLVNKEKISVSLSKELIKVINERKGIASRSAYIEQLIKEGLVANPKGENEQAQRKVEPHGLKKAF